LLESHATREERRIAVGRGHRLCHTSTFSHASTAFRLHRPKASVRRGVRRASGKCPNRRVLRLRAARVADANQHGCYRIAVSARFSIWTTDDVPTSTAMLSVPGALVGKTRPL